MDTFTTHSGRVLHLGASLTQQFRQILTRYCQESEVRYAALLEESGTVCADAGDASLRDQGETAALAAGAFAALQAVAKRLGDGTFEGFFHEGKTRQFCLTPVTPQFLMLSVFEAPVRFAVVKMCAAKTIARLQEQIETMPIPERGTLTSSLPLTSAPGDFSFEAAALFRQS
ncbi:MAG: hypothetical protein JWL81_1236 [Verrucomicrobiales bacterium]|nr:hypothetical protein [Verrucomicrobiales bacterium]